LRIIAGDLKGRRLKSLPKSKIRPTSDKVKGSIFNVLREEVEDKTVLDLFAGSGALGLEALSRGAKEVVFIDSNDKSVKLIKENLNILNFSDKGKVIKLDGISFLRRFKKSKENFQLIFCDPPYLKGMAQKLVDLISKLDCLEKNGILVLEHHKKEILQGEMDLILVKEKKFGDTIISFFIRKE